MCDKSEKKKKKKTWTPSVFILVGVLMAVPMIWPSLIPPPNTTCITFTSTNNIATKSRNLKMLKLGVDCSFFFFFLGIWNTREKQKLELYNRTNQRNLIHKERGEANKQIPITGSLNYWRRRCSVIVTYDPTNQRTKLAIHMRRYPRARNFALNRYSLPTTTYCRFYASNTF